MIHSMQDRFKTRIVTKFGETTTILTEREIRATCQKNKFNIKADGKTYEKIDDFDFNPRIVHIKGGFFLETPDITLITTN